MPQDEACYLGLACLGHALVEDEISQTVEDGDAVMSALRLYHMRMVADDGIGTGRGECLCLAYLLRCGIGLELYAPVEHADDAVRWIPRTIGAYGFGQCCGIRLARRDVAGGWHPVLQWDEYGTENGGRYVAFAYEGGR